MKKLLSAIAAIAVCTALTACGGSDDGAASASSTEASVAPETTIAPTETVPEETIENVSETVAETTAASTALIEETTEASATEVAPEETETPETSAVTITEAAVTETEAADEPFYEEEIVIEDDAEEMTVSSSFADMDEFLAADIFMLEGKTVTADKALSASIFDTLSGSFYFETSTFDGSSPFKLAVNGDMIMTETESDGKTNKMIIRDLKAYTFDHENKVALFIPADKELISQYAPEKMGIIPENVSKESFVIADVTIGGKAYKFEFAETSDWAMLYGADGKLYASVKSGDSLDFELYKFSVTSKIPSGTFDIPEDYFQLDLEEMMKNAPAAEESDE